MSSAFEIALVEMIGPAQVDALSQGAELLLHEQSDIAPLLAALCGRYGNLHNLSPRERRLRAAVLRALQALQHVRARA